MHGPLSFFPVVHHLRVDVSTDSSQLSLMAGVWSHALFKSAPCPVIFLDGHGFVLSSWSSGFALSLRLKSENGPNWFFLFVCFRLNVIIST